MTDLPTMTNLPVPPYDDGGDDDEPEFKPRPRRRAHALTFVLAGALLIAGGFYGGVLLQKHEDHKSNSTAATAASARTRFAAAAGTGATTGGTGTGTGGTGTGTAGRGGFGFGGGAGGGAVTGTVKFVDGTNVYITSATGDVVKVLTNDGSALTKTDPATTKDVVPGDTVIVRGTQNSDGSYTATAVVISSPATATAG
jgi:hypothetical protein